jgi:GNAT superfamily N-acetyltransferase
METEIALSEHEEKEFVEFLHAKIIQYNNDRSHHHREARKTGAVVPLNLILKDRSGNPIGGLSGNTYWGWLEIVYLVIPEELRGKGIGATLLKTAEAEAAKRGCTSCFLTTFDFQGRGFYESHGYVVAGRLEDYPPGSVYYWMRKDIPV